MAIYIKLTIAGADVGPFDLYSNATSPIFGDPPFETGITRQQLVDGFLCSSAPYGTTQIKIQSTGVCTNYVIVDVIIPATTTTSTTSTTTTLIPPTTTTTTTLPLYYQIRECQFLTDFLAAKTFPFNVGDVVEFDTIPTGGNLKPYCGTIIADDVTGPLTATLSSGVTRTCDPPDPTHCYQAPV